MTHYKELSMKMYLHHLGSDYNCVKFITNIPIISATWCLRVLYRQKIKTNHSREQMWSCVSVICPSGMAVTMANCDVACNLAVFVQHYLICQAAL